MLFSTGDALAQVGFESRGFGREEKFDLTRLVRIGWGFKKIL